MKVNQFENNIAFKAKEDTLMETRIKEELEQNILIRTHRRHS